MLAEFTCKIALCLWLICTCLAIIGCAYAVLAAALLGQFWGKIRRAATATPAVTMLKPLCGAEPDLEANLASFCTQDYQGPVQIVLGVQDADDPAAAVVERLVAKLGADTVFVTDQHRHGANRKISNIINMMEYAKHDVIVLSDSDMRVGPTYLQQVVGALEAPGVGLVTCLYRGLPAAGFWSRLAAAAIDFHFLPSVLVGLRLGLARPCFGSTVALSAETLRRIGGFEAFADQLADDYAIGEAVRRLGLEVAIPPMILDHACHERSFAELAEHELRWARTIRLVDPLGYAGSVVTHPLPFALAAATLPGPGTVSLAILGLTLACRVALPIQIGRTFGGGRVPIWFVPLRDLLSFAIFLASFVPGPVRWRGSSYNVGSDGTLTPT